MEYASFHEQQQEEENQSLVDSLCYGHSWYQNCILNGTRNHTYSRDVKQQHMYHNNNPAPMSRDMGLHSISMENFNAYELQQLARIKNELSVTGSCLDLPDIINCSPTSSTDQDFMSKNNDRLTRYDNDKNLDMLFKTFSNVCQNKSEQLMNPIPSYEESIFNSFDANSCYRGTFSAILPTLKISNTNQPSSPFDMKLRALDPFGYPTVNGSFNYQTSSFNAHNLGDLLKNNCLSYGVDQMMNSKIAPAIIVETTEVKRPASTIQNKRVSPTANPTKKLKLESRASSQLKVRKEKLGDRILALQQMVAPFGKTDTASVLMEAIGYIKFLQNQVETLSAPYMNSTHEASRISTRRASTKDDNEETMRDLRRRGLCLVPVSCLRYVTYDGGSVWANL